jgi:hypothetical protein
MDPYEEERRKMSEREAEARRRYSASDQTKGGC